MINNSGPITKPCGTPNNTENSSEFSPITETYCFRFKLAF